jgi:hypothetical protein
VAHTVHVRLSARPSSARFSIDGSPLATNPYDGDMPADGKQHKIIAQADGFEARTIDSSFDRDVVVDVALAGSSAPHPRPAHSAAPARSSTPAAPAKQRAIEEEDPYKK